MGILSQTENYTSCMETKTTASTTIRRIKPLTRPLTPIRTVEERRDLDVTFLPGEFDVICGKGKESYSHPGNIKFRKMVALYADEYASVTSRVGKSAIVSTIIHRVRSLSPDGGFIRKEESTGLWYEVGDLLAREKVGQTMREALHANYRSSTKAKKQRRLTEQESADESMAAIISSHSGVSSKVEYLQMAASGASAGESEMELGNIFAQANLDILNELNRLKQRVSPRDKVPPIAMMLTEDDIDGCTDLHNEDFDASSFQW